MKAADLKSLRAALGTMLSPLAYAGREEWCVLVGRRLQEFFQADATMLVVPIDGKPRNFSDQYPEMSAWFDQNMGLDRGELSSPDGDFHAGFQACRRYGMGAWTFSMVDRMTGHRLSRSEFYNDIVLPYTGVQSSVGVFARTPDGESAVSIGGFDRDWEPFGSDTIGMLELILPAFCAGLEILNAVGNAAKVVTTTIDVLAEGVLVCDRSLGRTLHRNRALEDMLASDPDGSTLTEAAERMARGLSGASGAARQLQPGLVVLSEIATVAARYRLRASLLPPGIVKRDGALLIAVERTTPPIPTPAQLVVAFGLTQREASIALRLGTGASDRAIAAALGLSPHTVRHHVESIFLKLGVHSRKAIAQHLLRAAVPPRTIS